MGHTSLVFDLVGRGGNTIETFSIFTATAAPLMRMNVDTEAIIPKSEMIRSPKGGLGEGLFAPWRYLENSSRDPDPDFILNKQEYSQTEILLAGANFGCGISREQAVWALLEYGIRAVIASSFGYIFYLNCIKNGLLPIFLSEDDIQYIVVWCSENPMVNQLEIDLERQQVVKGHEVYGFDIEEMHKKALLNGHNPIDERLEFEEEVLIYGMGEKKKRPWVAALDDPASTTEDTDFFKKK